MSKCFEAFEDMEVKHCFILVFVISGINGFTFKIGVLIDKDMLTKDLPSLVAVNHRLDHGAGIASDVLSSNLSDYTAEIMWEPISNWSLFHVVDVGNKLAENGSVAIFMIITKRNYHLKLDWLIPISGIGSYQHAGEALQEHDYPMDMKIYNLPTDNILIGAKELYSDILISLIIELHSNDAILVYDQETEFICAGITEKTRTNAIFLTMYKLDDSYSDEKINQFLEYIYKIAKSEKTIIAVCGSSMMRRLMNLANSFDDRFPRETSLNFISRWLLLYMNDEPLEDVTMLSNLNNVAIVNLPKNTITLDVPQYMTLEYILHLIDIQNTSESCMGDNPLFAALQEQIYSISRQIRKDNFDSIRFSIKTLMFQKSGRQWATIGEISLNGDINMHSPFFPNQKFGFNGKTFVVSTLEYFPFEYIVNGTWKGFCIELLHELSGKLNFTYYMTSPADNEWGRLIDDTSSWTGMVGQLQRKEVDLTFSPLIINNMREEVMDFTLGFFYEQTVILMKKLDPSETQWLRLIKPLRWEVILLTGCLVPVISLLVYALEIVNPFYINKYSRSSLHDVFWYIYGCVFNQGGQRLPRSQTGRTIICCWWLFCIMLSAIYCGNLIAFLTVTKEKLPFDSLEEMVKQNKYEWGTLGGTLWVTWFQHGTTPVSQSVWSGIVASNRTDPRILSIKVSTHVEKLKEGSYAYIAERSQIEIIAADDCDLHIAKEEFLPLQYGIGLPDNSPYTKMFSDVILGIHESGLMQIWKQKYWPKQSFCADSLIPEAKPIKWIDIQMAFILSGIGFFLGVFMLTTELIFSKCKNRGKTSSRKQSIKSNITMKSIS